MTQRTSIKLAALAAGSSMALLSACASNPIRIAEDDTLNLGRNAAGEPCAAASTASDDALSDPFSDSFAITCRNVSASRAQGFIRVVKDSAEDLAAIEATLSCGAASAAQLPGVGEVQARRCNDSSLGSDAVVIRVERDGATIVGTAVPSVTGPLERGIQRLLGATPDVTAGPAIDVAALAQPAGGQQADTAAELDPALALRQGISLNNRGLHVEASRLLNDALSRLPADAPAATRAELSLEAGLADSNIRFTQAADEHFARADALISSAEGEQRSLLVRKRDTYRAMDLLNRRQFRRALAALDQLVSARSTTQPLQDIAVLRAINQPARDSRDLATSVAVPDLEVLQQLEIDTQAQWAKSIALNRLGDTAGAEQALAAADAAFLPLSNERITRGPVHWLNAKLERQRGRLAAQRSDWVAAIASFDKAIESLTRGAIETGGQGNEPGIAEIRLERAAIVAQQGGPSENVRAAYAEAVDALIASGASSSVTPTGMETYLNLLVEDAQGGGAESAERYFRAVQAIGEPAVARQMSKIQAVVTADPTIGAKIRDRAELERDITRLRYEIADTDPSQTATIGNLEEQRRSAQERLTAIDTELAADTRVNISDDRPATIADIRSALRPGEVFLKITQLRTSAYGVLITPEATQIYRLGAPARDLVALANRVRNSIDGRLDEGRLVPFDVAASYALFRLISGPAADRVVQASSVILDPAGPLERLPAGVLVTDRESVDRFDAAGRFDYTGVNFLASKASVSTAVSPRSFLVARRLPASRALMPFIGFAEHEVPSASEGGADHKVEVGNVCLVDTSVLRALSAEANPISREEIEIASRALGAGATPLVAGAAFTDTAVEAMTDLANYKVLHFATHGLEEGVWGCPKSPPALVTSFGDENSDGLLSFDEIAGLRLDANLVVLSACDTGAGIRSQELARRSGQEEAGSTLQGLVRAFLTANARAVMATHWEVPAKEGTRELIETFYGSAGTRDIGGSLQAAQQRLMTDARYSHPFYWGAYFVVGDSSKSALGQPPQVAETNPSPRTGP